MSNKLIYQEQLARLHRVHWLGNEVNRSIQIYEKGGERGGKLNLKGERGEGVSKRE